MYNIDTLLQLKAFIRVIKYSPSLSYDGIVLARYEYSSLLETDISRRFPDNCG